MKVNYRYEYTFIQTRVPGTLVSWCWRWVIISNLVKEVKGPVRPLNSGNKMAVNNTIELGFGSVSQSVSQLASSYSYL